MQCFAARARKDLGTIREGSLPYAFPFVTGPAPSSHVFDVSILLYYITYLNVNYGGGVVRETVLGDGRGPDREERGGGLRRCAAVAEVAGAVGGRRG